MCGAKFYRALPYFYALICILEVISSIFLLIAVTGNWSTFGSATGTTQAPSTTTTTTAIPPGVLTKRIAAVSIALVGAIVPLFTGIILFLSLFGCCICFIKKSCRDPCLRFIALNCYCPCYIPRPKLRFTVRLGFHIFCITLRIIAVIMYAILLNETTTSTDRNVIQALLAVTAGSLIFPFLTILLDLYHYRVWWAYEPDIIISADIVQKPFSRKHKRFIPYVLTEPFRTATFGNRKCKNGDRCQSRELEHIVIFHSSLYQPQPRWSDAYPIYIGFHRTTPEAAYKIATSEFRPSAKGMLGPGAYFARSTEATKGKIGKADQTGAWFVAEILMGKVYPINSYSIRSHPNNTRFNPDLCEYVKEGKWSDEFDTCYYRHHKDVRDEFCIKDPNKQILKWIVIIEAPYDRKLSSYGLDAELKSGRYGCC